MWRSRVRLPSERIKISIVPCVVRFVSWNTVERAPLLIIHYSARKCNFIQYISLFRFFLVFNFPRFVIIEYFTSVHALKWNHIARRGDIRHREMRDRLLQTIPLYRSVDCTRFLEYWWFRSLCKFVFVSDWTECGNVRQNIEKWSRMINTRRPSRPMGTTLLRKSRELSNFLAQH